MNSNLLAMKYVYDIFGTKIGFEYWILSYMLRKHIHNEKYTSIEEDRINIYTNHILQHINDVYGIPLQQTDKSDNKTVNLLVFLFVVIEILVQKNIISQSIVNHILCYAGIMKLCDA